jgi:TRAP-type C4-dicarboxylate transport system permease small subunit
MKQLMRWIDVVIHAMLWLALLAGALMMLHVVADVTGRTVFRHPLPGTTEIVAGYYMVAVAYLPWAYVARTDGHIIAEMFTRFGSEAFNFWLEIVVKIATLFFTGVFSQQTYLRAVSQTSAGESVQIAGGFLITWPTRWMLPISAGLMTLYLVLRVTDDIIERRRASAADASA